MRFALLVFYAAGTLAAPVLDGRLPPSEVKDITCSGIRFRRGTTFEYAYAGETINKVEGATTDSTGLQLTSRVLITQLEECDLRMQIQDAELRTKSMNQASFGKSAETESFKKALEMNDLLFRMEDGRITTLHPHKSETTEILNIKRGILSTLQLEEDAKEEDDVNGVCKTTVTKTDDVIVKTKTLSDCSNRVQDEIGIQSASIKTQSDLKPLKSKSKCTYSKDGETIRMVTCEETHMFRPFSAGYETPSGAMTTVRQVLKFIDYANAAHYNINRDEYNRETSLIFDHSEDKTQTESLNTQVEEVMKRLIDQSHLSVKQTSAHEFTSLVFLFRKMSQKKMKFIWEKYFDCVKSGVCGKTDMNLKDLYRQYMLDAIAYCGTPSCVSVVKDVAISGEVSGERANMFLQSIALVGKTTNGMIRDVLDIAQQKPSRQVFLTLGTLISRHCSKSPADCVVQAKSPVTQAENFLETTLGKECTGQESHIRVEEILMTLKAIGNAKRPTNARSALIRCAKNSMHTNITMSAFDALRGMGCDETILDELREVIMDENIDSDKRIYAFTASMKCPTKNNLEKLVHHYNLETSNQLTSFMWSYFTNILESSDPADKVAKEHLLSITKETPLKVTDLPMYQYSKNFEKSIYIESLKSGASAKANLVFHPDGFLPKTAVFDMTAKIMDVPVDLVETAIGIDGVETLLENVLGPEGDLPNNFVLNMFNWTVTAEKLRKMAQRRNNREKRSINPDDNLTINKIHQKVDKKPVQPSGFLSLKVMGQEVRIMSYDDIYAMIDQIDNMNVIQLLMKLAKGGQKTFSKSMMFLEMTHSVPTGVGLPLKLKLVGSTVGTVELNGKFDIRNMFWGPSAMSINGYIKPSAVVEVSGQMGIESNYVSTGLLVSSNMIVSNLMKGSINYKEGQLLKINLDTPSEPVQLFKFSSTPYMFMNENTDMIEGVPRIIKSDKCLKSQLIGYGLCTSVRVPIAFRNYESPYFPLSGPAHFGMTLVRGDEKLTTYQFLMSMTKKNNGLDGLIELSTPGATYERKLSGEMAYTNVDNIKTVTVTTERYGKTGSIELSYNTISHRASIEAKNNFFTKKDMVARLVYFNQTSHDIKQYGIRASAEYDWYKFEHVTKYVKTQTTHSLNSKTTYYPNKAVSGVVEYDTVEKKVTARFDADQIKQASVEVTGKWINTIDEKGVTITATHVTSGKSAVFYGGYKTGGNMKEIMTSVTVNGKAVENHLRYHVIGDIHTIEDILLWNNSSANFVATLENKSTEKSIKFSADILGKKASSAVLYTNLGTKKTIDITVNVMSRKASTNIEITNSDAEKSIKMAVNAVGKTAQTKMGYYKKNDLTVFRFDCDIMGKHAELFWNIQTAEGYRSTMGAVFGKYNGGIRSVYTTNHGKDKSVCSSIYYGTIDSEKYPLKTCVSLTDVSTETITSKQAVLSLELPLLSKKAELILNVQKEAGHVTFVSESVYNTQVLCKQTFDVEYKDPSNSYATFAVKAGNFTGELKTYTKKDADITDFGFQASAMGKTVLFLNQYKQTVKEGTKNMIITSTVTVNGKTLPVSTVVSYLFSKGFTGITGRLNIGKYSIIKSFNIMYKEKYGIQCEGTIMKEDIALFKVFNEFVVTYTKAKKEVEQKYGFVVNGKMYKYGWEIGYDDQITESKRAHAISLRLQYATDRKSTATFTFANSVKVAELLIDVEYIPTKKVSHSIRYSKAERQLDVRVEFLPKMFAKFMASLEKEDGYKLNTQMTLEWKKYKSVISIVNTYVNNDKMFKISTNFGKDVGIALTFNKVSPKSLSLSGHAFGKSVEFIGEYQNMDLKLKFLVNGKRIFKFEVSYDEIAKSVRLIIKKGEKTIVDLTAGYNKFLARYKNVIAHFEKFLKKYKFTIADVKQWAAGVKKWVSGIQKWVNIDINRSKESTTIITFNIMGKKYLKAIFNKKTKSMSVQFRNDVSLLFSYLPKTKSFTFSAKTKTDRIGLIVRADWENLIAAIHGIVNKNTFGMKAFVENKALNFKLIVTPELTMKTIFAFTDNTLTMTVQRISGEKVINEAAFDYKLSKTFCELMFKWNTEYIEKFMKRLSDVIRPMLKTTLANVRSVLLQTRKQFSENYGKLMGGSLELAKKARDAILSFLNKMDKAFDDFDFVAARDKVGVAALKALRKLSDFNIKSLKSIATMLDNLKAKLPTSAQKLKELYSKLKLQLKKALNILTADGKLMVAKAEEMMEKAKEMGEKAKAEAKVLFRKAEELAKKGKEMLKTLEIDVDKNLKVIQEIVMKVVRNLTESTKPVIQKAIFLLKDFKIRGKRLEDIVMMIKANGMKYMKIYIKKININFDELKAKAIVKFNELKGKAIIKLRELKVKLIELKLRTSEVLKEASVYVMKLKVPYINKTVGELVKVIKLKVAELKVKIEELKAKIEGLKEKITSLDAKKLLEEMKTKILSFEIKGKTVQEYITIIKQKMAELEVKIKKAIIIIKHKITVLKEEIKDFPKISREALHQLVNVTRKYITNIDNYVKDIEEYVNKVADFAKPLTKHAVLVSKSIKKHFGPLYEKIVSNIMKRISEIKFPRSIKPLIKAELKKIADFFLPMLEPIVPLLNNIKNQIRKMDVMGFKVGPFVDMQIEEFDNAIKTIVTKFKTKMDKQKKIINAWLTKLRTLTPEQLIDKSMDKSIAACNEIIEYLTKIYKGREATVKTAIKEIEDAYRKLKIQIKKSTEKLTTVMVVDPIIDFTAKFTADFTGELSKVIKQVANMDISEPAWKAWTDADVIGHLGKYGINDKISAAIKRAKDVNITEVVLKTSATIEEFMTNNVRETGKKVIAEIKKIYDNMKRVIDYIKSIPKKDYDTWLAELKQFALTNERALVQLLKKVYETSLKRATKSYESMRKLVEVESQKIYQDYVVVAKKWFQLFAEASRLVYNDVKQPTIIVCKYYKNMISDFIIKQYGIIKAKIEAIQIDKIYAELKTKIKVTLEKIFGEMGIKLGKKIDEIRVKVKKIYADFLAKYGDMTWEEVYRSLEKLAKEKYVQFDKKVIAQYKKISNKIMEKIEVIKKKVLEIKGKLMAEYTKIEKLIKSYPQLKQRVIDIFKQYKAKAIKTYREYKAKVIATYKKYDAKVMEIFKQYKAKAIYIYKNYTAMAKIEVEKMVLTIKKMFIEVKTKVTDFYNKNKDKTLKQIYTEIKKIIMPMYLKQKRLIIEFVVKKIARAKELAKEIQRRATQVIQKYDTMMREVVLPELVKEAESIINQTLRNHVIMIKEVIKAYKPHAIIVKRVLSKYVEIVKAKMPVIIAKLKKYVEIVKENIPVITAKVNKYIEIVKAEIPAIISKVKKYMEIAKAQIPFITDTVKKMAKKINAKIDAIKVILETLAEDFIRLLKELKQDWDKTTLRDIIKNTIKGIKGIERMVVEDLIPRAIENIKKLCDIIRKNDWEKIVKSFLKQTKLTIDEMKSDLKDIISRAVRRVETNPTVLKIKAKLIALKKLVLQEIENLKINPTVLKLRAELADLKKRILQKVEELKKNPTVLKIKEKLVELKKLILQKIEESKVKLIHLKKQILQRVEVLKTNPTLLEIKAKLIEFKKLVLEKFEESKVRLVQMKKQILQKIEELKVNPTVLKLKAKMIELKKQILQKFEESKLKLVELKEQIERKFKELGLKSWAKLKELEKQISEKIEELKKSETVLKIKARMVELKKQILQKLEELNKNPTVLKIRATVKDLQKKFNEINMKLEAKIKEMIKMIEAKVKEMKIKIAEIKVEAGIKGKELMKTLATYKSLLEKRYKSAMPEVVEVLKQMKKSGKFTADKLMEEMKPYLEKALAMIISDLAELPKAVKKAVNYYMEAPEDAFWAGVAVTKEAITDAYKLTKSLNTKQIVDKCKLYYDEVVDFSKNLATKCTDKWTKDTAQKLYQNAKELLEKINGKASELLKKIEIRLKSFIAYIKELRAKAIEFYKKNLPIVEARLKKEWSALKTRATETWSTLKTRATEKWLALEALAKKEWVALKTAVTKKLAAMEAQIKKELEDLKTRVTEKWTAMKAKAAEKWIVMKAKAIEEWKALKIRITKEWVAFKTSWDKCILKAVVDNPIWNEIADEVKNHELVHLAKQVKDMGVVKFNELKKKVLEVYGKRIATLKKIFDDLKVKVEAKYTELKKEVMAKYTELKKEVMANYTELKAKVEATYAKLKPKIEAKYAEIKLKVETKYTELKKEVMAKYAALKVKLAELKVKLAELKVKLAGWRKELPKLKEIIKAKYIELKGKAIERYNEIVKQLQKFYEETTIADMVAFIEKTYNLALEKVKEVTAKFDELKVTFQELKEKYTKEAKILWVKYEKKVKEMYKKVQGNVMELVKEVQAKVMHLYETLRAKVMAIYKKYRPIVEAEYKKALAKFNELKEKFIKIKTKVIAKQKELQAKVEAKFEELKKIFNELKVKVEAKFNELKAEVEAKFNELKKIFKELKVKVEAKFNEVKEKVMVKLDAIKAKLAAKDKEILAKLLAVHKKVLEKWTKSKLRADVIAFKKMVVAKYNEYMKTTVRETIKFLKKVATKEYIEERIEKIYKQSKVIATETLKVIEDKLEKKYEDLINFLKIQQQKLMKELQPYLTPTKKAYAWMKNEIEQTAVFIYKYYGLLEKYHKIVDYIKMEIKRIRDYITKETKKIVAAAPVFLEKYSEQCKAALKKTAGEYAEKCQKLVQVYARDAQEFVKTAGDKTLRGIHYGMKYIDNIDVGKIKTKVSRFVNKIHDYVSVDVNDGEIVLRIYHREITPSFRFQINKVKLAVNKVEIATMKKVNDLKRKGQELLKKIKAELAVLKEKAEKLRQKIQKQVMASTVELRKDMKLSYKSNKNISTRLFIDAKQVANNAEALMKLAKESLTKKAKDSIKMMKTLSKVYYVKFMEISKEVFVNADKILMDIYNSPSVAEAYKKFHSYVNKYYKIVETVSKMYYDKYEPIIKEILLSSINRMKQRGIELEEELKPYYSTLKTAYEQLKAGVPVKEALKPILDQLKSFKIDFNVNIIAKICKKDPLLCKYVNESVELHKMLAKKYAAKVRDYFTTANAQLDRAVRIMNKMMKIKDESEGYIPGERYLATAMIMGNHILTFDYKFYEFVDFKSTECSYLLARDFQDKKFTIVKTAGGIVIETPDMAIKIRDDGRTKTTIDNRVTFSLPVESGDSRCVRVDNLVLCHFKDQKMKVTVDLKHQYTTISISGWYQGKSQGLLGTYNHETHDDWRLPNNKIAKNINVFANAYELTGNPKCKLALKEDHVKTCIKPASRRCQRVFASSKSPLAKFFDILNPSPFMEACRCVKRAPRMQCNLVASYIAMLRTRGMWVSQLPECMSDKGRSLNEEWVQKPAKKNLDIVIMISQRATMMKSRKRISVLLYHLHKILKQNKIAPRFSLIGFGGHGVHEQAHIHPLRRGQTVFGYISDLNKAIKNMPFKGENTATNDAYHAILIASKLRFRAGAEKSFILFNTEPHDSHENGPSFNEALYILRKEANAPLFVFDDINFPSFGKTVGHVIGVTTRKLYTSKNLQGVANNNLVLPSSEFRTMALQSEGGLFSNMLKVPKQIAISLHDAIFTWVKADSKLCKRCTLKGSWTGLPRPVCISDPKARC